MSFPLIFDPTAFKRDVYDKLNRDEQDGLYAFLWAERASSDAGYTTAWPGSDVAFSPEAFRPIELAAMATGSGLTTAAAVRATLRAGFSHQPFTARVDAVTQIAKQGFWLNL